MALRIKVVEESPGFVRMEGDKYLVAFHADQKGRPEKNPEVASFCDRPNREGRVELPMPFYKQFYKFAAIRFWLQKKQQINSLPLFSAGR